MCHRHHRTVLYLKSRVLNTCSLRAAQRCRTLTGNALASEADTNMSTAHGYADSSPAQHQCPGSHCYVQGHGKCKGATTTALSKGIPEEPQASGIQAFSFGKHMSTEPVAVWSNKLILLASTYTISHNPLQWSVQRCHPLHKA